MRWVMRGMMLGATLLAPVGPLRAQGPMRADTGTFVMQDFRFASGEILAEVHIHYRTLGHPRRGPDGTVRNAVLVLHGTGGSGQGFLGPSFAGELFAPGQPLDSARFYIIIPDNLGHGRSSKPSDGLHARFPSYDYEDMTTAQYRLVTEGLHVNHLHLVMGTSMGCMHSWMWGERWPDFVDGLVPLACLPTQIAGRNRMWRKLVIDDIRNDPAWNHGDYHTQPQGLTAALELLWFVGTAPLNEQRLAPTQEAADTFITRWLLPRLGTTDANDLMYAVAASRDYDPSGQLERIQAPVLAINSADDEINPPDLGVMEQLMPRVRQVRYILLPVSPATRGHGTHSLPAIWKHYLLDFVQAIQPERPE